MAEWSTRVYGHQKQHRGLAYGGDWYSADHLAELLSGEDEGRVKTEDIHRLLDLIEAGRTAVSLTGEEWNLLGAICETWLDNSGWAEPADMLALARRIAAAAEAGND